MCESAAAYGGADSHHVVYMLLLRARRTGFYHFHRLRQLVVGHM